jgi:hypothetical protein
MPFPPVPRSSGVDPLLLAAMYAVCALDEADDESADPDWAVAVMESVYEYLGQANRPMIRRELKKLVIYAQKAKWPRKVISMLKKEMKHFATSD